MEENKKYRTFVFVADQDIFHSFRIEENEYAAQLIAGLQSGPLILDVTGNEQYSNQPGWKYIDGEFVRFESVYTPPEGFNEEDYEVE